MITHLKGGLGNQMFQYAFGRAVAEERKEPILQFTRHAVDADPKRCYGLGVFDLPINFAPDMEKPIYEENPYSYNPQVYITKAKSFDGQWQTERYFQNNILEVQSAFFRRYDKMSNESMRVAEEIAKQPSAFIHVRRSDYIAGDNSQWHTHLTKEYYDRAIKTVQTMKENVRFFVFSDDPEWCRHEFPDFTVVGHNKPGGRMFGKSTPGDEHQDLWLMSMCDNAIIANSSFSWWGAWLGGTREDRTVVAPQTWFGPKLAYLDTSDIIPERWIKI